MSEEMLEGAPTLHIKLSVCGRDFDAENITQRLGLQPTEIWTQPNRQVNIRFPERNNICWRLALKNLRVYSVDEAVSRLIEVLRPAQKGLRLLADDTDLKMFISCSVIIEVDRPAYELSVESMAAMADFGCFFDLDIIDYSGADE